MGFLNRLLGYPDIDPTGRSRALFEKVGKQSMTMFFRGQVEGALEHPQQLIGMVSKRHGLYHADIGRAYLLGATIMTMTSQTEPALQTCEAALEALRENADVASMDLEVAEYLEEGLKKLLKGERQGGGEEYLISQDTPIGQWLLQLKS